MKIKPAKKIVVLEERKLSDITTGTIEAMTEGQPLIGEVVAVGEPGTDGMPLEMEKGDIIAYRKFGETKVFAEGRELLFVSFEDVIAKIK